MCPPDKILIVFGKVGTGQPAKCYHGGSTFVLPVLQSYSYLDLNPINIDVPLQGALSSQNIRVDVPSSFIVGISTLPEIMQNAAARLLGRSREEIRNLAAEIIMGQMRVVIASMTIEEINSDREKLIKGITEGVDVELHKVGLHLINANITDIQDASGYISALGKEAAARAINDATIKVAEETRRGEIGKAEAEKDQTVQVANARAIAIEGQNEAQIKIAESAAKLQVKQAEAKKLAEVAQKVQEAKTLEEAYEAEKEAEIKRAERERATQEANILVTARICGSESWCAPSRRTNPPPARKTSRRVIRVKIHLHDTDGAAARKAFFQQRRPPACHSQHGLDTPDGLYLRFRRSPLLVLPPFFRV